MEIQWEYGKHKGYVKRLQHEKCVPWYATIAFKLPVGGAAHDRYRELEILAFFAFEADSNFPTYHQAMIQQHIMSSRPKEILNELRPGPIMSYRPRIPATFPADAAAAQPIMSSGPIELSRPILSCPPAGSVCR